MIRNSILFTLLLGIATSAQGRDPKCETLNSNAKKSCEVFSKKFEKVEAEVVKAKYSACFWDERASRSNEKFASANQESACRTDVENCLNGCPVNDAETFRIECETLDSQLRIQETRLNPALSRRTHNPPVGGNTVSDCNDVCEKQFDGYCKALGAKNYSCVKKITYRSDIEGDLQFYCSLHFDQGQRGSSQGGSSGSGL